MMARLLRAVRALPWLVLLGLLALAAAPARAHKASDSYLALTVEADGRMSGQWDIALRDLDHALGLDADGNGEITWGEVRVRHAEIASYALARLAVSRDGQRCTVAAGAQQVDSHTDGAYTVLPLRIDCAPVPGGGPGQALDVTYRLFADLDPQHRGLLRLRAGPATRSAVFAPESDRQRFGLAAPGAVSTLLDHGREGVWHIWIGFDHILFLVSLLLPAVMVWQARPPGGSRWSPAGGRWLPAPAFRGAFIDVLKIVSAFTLAHSLTLSAATLGWIELPSRLVESSIAASVVLAALNNLWPVALGRRWWAAFGFGLIHGFGFASVLADLGLPSHALALALLGFNLGVELGQLAIVAVFLPLAFALRGTRLYLWGVLRAGSVLIALLAAVWFAERAFNLQLMA